VNDGLINVLILLALGAGSLLQWWLKKQRASRAAAPAAPEPSSSPAVGSLEDVLAELFGGEPKARPAMDWHPISAPPRRTTTMTAAAALELEAKAEQDELPRRVVADTVMPGQLDATAAPAAGWAASLGPLAPADLRRAFIMKELLDPPVSLR
jgi:hypothetical protein